MAPIWRNRDFVLLWAGRLVSTLGSGISAIALPLLVLFLTRSPAKAGLVSAVAGTPYFLFSVAAGVAVDRGNRKTILIACDTGRAIVWAFVGVSVLRGRPSLALLVVAAACEGTLFVFHNVAMSAAMPRVVTREQLPAAIAQNTVILGTSDLLGPAIGGAIFQVGRSLPFLIDAVSYLASIFSVALVKTPLDPPLPDVRSGVLSEAAEGLRFLRRNVILRTLTLVGGIGDLLFAGITLVLIVGAQRLAHARPAAIGLMFAAASVAGIVGAVVAPRIVARLGVGRSLAAFAVAGTLIFAGLVFARTVVSIAALWAANILVLEVANVARETLHISVTPDELRGRVNGFSELVAYGGLPIGIALAGFSLAAFGPVATLAMMAIGRALMTVWLVATPAIRRFR